VASQVLLEVVRLRETLLADLARERTFARVRSHVLRQVAAVTELVVADDTRVALLTGVRDHVPLQSRRVDEGLGAHGADVRTFTRVRPHVFLQQVGPCVLVTADLAGKRAFPRVDQHVTPQHIRLTELHTYTHNKFVLDEKRTKLQWNSAFGMEKRNSQFSTKSAWKSEIRTKFWMKLGMILDKRKMTRYFLSLNMLVAQYEISACIKSILTFQWNKYTVI